MTLNDPRHSASGGVPFRKLRMEELGRPTLEGYKQQPKHRIVVALDNIRSLHNVGAIFRTADAFNIEALVLCGFTGCPPRREIHAAALGAERSVPWQHFDTAQEALTHYQEQGYALVAVEQCVGSTSLASCALQAWWKPPLVLFVGNEVHGVTQEVISACDACVEIPQWGTKHSLNVATATGIILWQLLHDHHLTL